MHQIIIADTHILYRQALKNYLAMSAPDLEVVEAESSEDVFYKLKVCPDADAIFVDNDLAREDLKSVSRDYPGIKKIIMAYDDTEVDYDVAGVEVMPKNLSGARYTALIKDIVAGDKVSSILSRQDGQKPVKHQNIHLTPREKEVLGYLVQGASNKEIARALDLQVVTVKLHVRGICRKLGAKNRTQAALKAREFGLRD